MELAPIAGSLLETVLGHDDGLTVLGSCSQHGYDAMLQGGSGGVNTRDLMSVANLHQLRMTPRESQMFSDRAVREQVSTPERAMMARQLELGGESDLLTLAISLEQGCSPSAMAVAAMDELDEQQQTVLYGLAVAAVTDGGVSQTLLQTLFGRNALEAIDAIAARGLAVRREGYVWGPHQAMALHVLRAHGMLDSRQQVDLAERILRTLHATDPVRANAVTRVLLHADTELGPPLWSRCADLWVTAAEQSEPAELVELIAPTLRLAGDHGTAAGFLQRHLNHATLGRRASFELARCLHRLSSYNAAADIFESFLEDKSYSVVARLNLALSAIGQGRYEDAELLLRVLEKNELGIPGLHHLLGYVAELRGDLPVAMERYQQARGQYWFDNLALRRLGSLKIATGANREAIRLFEAGLQQEPDRVEYYGALAAAHYLDDNAARAAAQSVRAIQAGVEPALARKAVAHGYFQYGLYEPALTELRNCLIYRPDDLEAHVMIAECLHNQNNLREATEALYDALEIDADFVTAKQHLASYLCDLKQYEQATRLIDEILGSQSPTAELSLLAARVAANAGDMQTSARHAAIALDAGDESGWGWFISAHATTDAQAQYNYEKAIPLLSQTTVTAPRLASASACQALAIARCALGDHPGAFRAARQGTNRLIHELYGGEPVLSAVALRHIAGKEFLQEIAQLTDEMRQTDRVTE